MIEVMHDRCVSCPTRTRNYTGTFAFCFSKAFWNHSKSL